MEWAVCLLADLSSVCFHLSSELSVGGCRAYAVGELLGGKGKWGDTYGVSRAGHDRGCLYQALKGLEDVFIEGDSKVAAMRVVKPGLQ